MSDKWTCLIGVARGNYYNDKLDLARYNLKQTCKILNKFMYRRVAKTPYPTRLSKNGVKISNPVDIANNLLYQQIWGVSYH